MAHFLLFLQADYMLIIPPEGTPTYIDMTYMTSKSITFLQERCIYFTKTVITSLVLNWTVAQIENRRIVYHCFVMKPRSCKKLQG